VPACSEIEGTNRGSKGFGVITSDPVSSLFLKQQTRIALHSIDQFLSVLEAKSQHMRKPASQEEGVTQERGFIAGGGVRGDKSKQRSK
jgi:hypothetical protein